MGYNKSKEAVERVKVILDTVLAANGKVTIPSKHPIALAYAIREAYHSAEEIKGDYEKYNTIRVNYKLRTKSGCIVFDPRIALEYENPVVELAKALEELSVPNVETLFQVVGACIKHKAPIMVFPDAKLETSDLLQLYKWADSNNYTVDVKGLLTMRRNGTGVADSGTQDSVAKQG